MADAEFALALSAAQPILKTNYEGPVRDQINRKCFLVDKVQEGKNVQYVGLESYIPLSVGFNAGTGPRPESTNLPDAGTQEYDKARYNQKYLYGVIRVTGQMMAMTRNSKGAFIRALRSEMDGLIKNCQQMQNRMLWHDGSGMLTGLSGTEAAAQTVISVNSVKHCFRNMKVRVRTISDGTDKSGAVATITAIDKANKTITLSDALDAGADTTEGVWLEDSKASTWGYAMDLWGLEALISNGNPGNGLSGELGRVGKIDRTSLTEWQANVIANGGTLRDLTLDLMQQAYDACDIEGGTRPGAILTNHAMRRRFVGLLLADRRYDGKDTPFEGDAGWVGPKFNRAVVLVDKDAGKTINPDALNAMYFAAMEHLERHVSQPWGWMADDGSILKWTGQDSYKAVYRTYWELCTDQPNAHAKLADLIETP